MTSAERKRIIGAALLASSAKGYALAMDILREAQIDACFICGKSVIHKMRTYVIRYEVGISPGISILPDFVIVNFARLKRENLEPLGWVCGRRAPCVHTFYAG